MQVYAFDENRSLLAAEAEKGKNYCCPECRGVVRLRRGLQRQPHFFHLAKSPACRLSQKGLIHLQLQYLIKNLFTTAQMELPFPQIGRIADVAHLESNTIFEIQFSPMSLEEAKSRCADYESLGLQVVWILHDQTYNQRRITPTERFLRTKCCYFSNIDSSGKGLIYDQFDQTKGKRRRGKSGPLPVDLRTLKPLPQTRWPLELRQRALSWPLYCDGDLIDLHLNGKFLFEKIGWRIFAKFKALYVTALHILLSRSSK